MRHATLTRIASSHSRIRTPEVVGIIMVEPQVGRDFVMYAPALESGDLRMVSTTPIESIASIDSVIYFRTATSKYMLLLGDEVTE